jgi:hypothetical protein
MVTFRILILPKFSTKVALGDVSSKKTSLMGRKQSDVALSWY